MSPRGVARFALLVGAIGVVSVAGWLTPFAVESALGAAGFEDVRSPTGVAFLLESSPIPQLWERDTAIAAALATLAGLLTVVRWSKLAISLLLFGLLALGALGDAIRDRALEGSFGSGAVPSDDRQLLALGTGYWIAIGALVALLLVAVWRSFGGLTAPASRPSLPSGARSGGSAPPRTPSGARG